ncbi:hypothetical protein V6N12_012467 [Hibiscus sabdariffa]|uniref:RNase H type-1 domain-containing protein n=1 Tax=Hibiscus sabdariffa TaxID=183260 RepID=A0ABR1ZFY1_9ROSI
MIPVENLALRFSVGYCGRVDVLRFSARIPLLRRISYSVGNIDASVHTVTGQATIGGLLRDEHWDWVVGFTRPVGRCSVLVVELWALHDMLHCPWSEGFQRVISETDCLEVVRILQRVSPSLSGTGLVASIFRLTGYVWDLVIRHVPRDCNVFADRLSAWGRLHPQEVVTLDQPPLSLHA